MILGGSNSSTATWRGSLPNPRPAGEATAWMNSGDSCADGANTQTGSPSPWRSCSTLPTGGPRTAARGQMGFRMRRHGSCCRMPGGGRGCGTCSTTFFTLHMYWGKSTKASQSCCRRSPPHWGGVRLDPSPSAPRYSNGHHSCYWRRGKHVRADATLQWARAGRQGVELVATIRRVTQMARDWGVPTWLVKLDIRKAFDSVWQHSMGELVAARVGGVPSDRCPVPANGGEQPWEANLWLSVLETRALNIAVGDVLTTVPQTNGIRQGSPDSPDLFGAIVARDLASAIQAAPAQPPDSKGGPPPPKTGGCFLDDTYLWSQNKQHLQATLEGLEAELHEDGLSIHPTKTAILYSQPTGGGTLRIAGEEVECCPHKTVITTLGSPISFGEQTTMIIAEMGRRSRNAFHKHKAVLKTKSSLKSRALAHITLVRNAGLYACETWPAHHRILKAELRALARQEEGAKPRAQATVQNQQPMTESMAFREVPGAPNSYNAIAAATGSREIPLNVKPIPGMTMVEHYLWVTTGQIPPSYVTRELLDPDSPHNTEDQGKQRAVKLAPAHSNSMDSHVAGGEPLGRDNTTASTKGEAKHAPGDPPTPTGDTVEPFGVSLPIQAAPAFSGNMADAGAGDTTPVDRHSMVERGAYSFLNHYQEDQALQGHLQWHRPAFWEEIEQLVTPANSLVE
ncbi:unnamed protein product, partial [Symbiodinium microadriaticum]